MSAVTLQESHFMPAHNVATRLVDAISTYHSLLAMTDAQVSISYGQLGSFVEKAGHRLRDTPVVGIFGAPGVAMGACAVACVIHGKPFVHLDPAMPQMVLHNILSELQVGMVMVCQPPAAGQLPGDCPTLDAVDLLDGVADAPSVALHAAAIEPGDAIYLVATSGTTGRPKCIPVAQDAAYLSYEWRDAFTPYHEGMRIGIYIFAIWEIFRPLRDGAELWFPAANTLMAPRGLADFLIGNRIEEMLFTPSFYDSFLHALDRDTAAALPLSRVILNGEVVSDDLVAASLDKVQGAALWNLYSICETHDVCMSRLTAPSGSGPLSVGVPMEHLRAVILDENDAPCPAGTCGQLHFEGPRMLGPGYVNRPEETRLRFRQLTLEGQQKRLYDTGDQAWLDADGALHIVGRVAHMLKLRGFSIQTRELVDTMHDRLDFAQAVPWVAEVGARGQSLIFYYAANAEQAQVNADRWGLQAGPNHVPAALARELRAVLPTYCVPSFLVQLDAIPLHPVSGKADMRSLPVVTDDADTDSLSEDAVIAAAALAMGCSADLIDPALSFHDQGGDSLMCVTLMLELERTYHRPVDFELAMNVPLHRLDQLLTQEADAPAPTDGFDRPGILLTGATGFLGAHVLAHAARQLPQGHVVYCLVRDKRRGARDRLDEVAQTQGVAADRFVMVPGTLDAPNFGLEQDAYSALAASVDTVIHCAAMVNMAIGQDEMLEWSARGIQTVLDFCGTAGADLRFTSSSAVFPDRGGPWPEAAATLWDNCTGYGAAKIAAEQAIIASRLSCAIVRLPSLYDLGTPNPRDIYEIILAASFNAGVFPQYLEFPMTDVTAAARFLLGPISGPHAPVYNLMAGERVTVQGHPEVPLTEWLARVDLPQGIARVIADYPETLRADASFANNAAKAVWTQVWDGPFTSISDTAQLLDCRKVSARKDPALT